MVPAMSPLIGSLVAGAAVASLAFVGFGSLLLAKERLARWLAVLVAFAAGGLLGGAFFHLLPEAVELGGPVFPMALVGLLAFFLLDSLLWIYHCHGGHRLHADHGDAHGSCPPKPVGWLNLVGDAVHNIVDGVAIASAFLADTSLGVSTAIAVALHEIPQEVGDFGILVHSGFGRRRALQWNGVVALTIFIGIAFVFGLRAFSDRIVAYALPFTAGGFLYMACTNFLSEIKEEGELSKRLWQTGFLILGVAVSGAAAFFE
jgi:zinc and cadmium transporter